MAADSHTDRIKVEAAQLTIGMYVVELDRPWTDTSFLFQGFRIRQQQEIRLLQEACSYVWVDAHRSIGMLNQLAENLAQPDNLQPVIAKVEFNLEIQQAAPTWHAAREESLRILQAVKMGQELDVGAVKAVIKDCVESILRNPAAMLWLARIKNSDDYTVGGRAYLGEEAWEHLEEEAGEVMSTFIEKYVRRPIEDISRFESVCELGSGRRSIDLLDFRASYRGDQIVIQVGDHHRGLQRREDPRLAEEVSEEAINEN